MPGSRDGGLILILILNLLPGGTVKGSWRLDEHGNGLGLPERI